MTSEVFKSMGVTDKERLLFLIKATLPPSLTGIAQRAEEHPRAPIASGVQIVGDAQVPKVHIHDLAGYRISAHHSFLRFWKSNPEVAINRAE